MHTSFQTRMPSGQSPGHRAPWVWHIRHTDSLHFCIFLVCILHNVYICIYKHTSGWGLPYFMPQQQSPSAVGAAGSQHNTQLKRIFLPSSPLRQYCLCWISQPPPLHPPKHPTLTSQALSISHVHPWSQQWAKSHFLHFRRRNWWAGTAAAAWVPSGHGRAAGKTTVKNRIGPCSPPDPLPWYLCYFPIDAPWVLLYNLKSALLNPLTFFLVSSKTE